VLHVVLDAVVDVRNLNRKIGSSKCCHLLTRLAGRSGKKIIWLHMTGSSKCCQLLTRFPGRSGKKIIWLHMTRSLDMLFPFFNGKSREKPLNHIGSKCGLFSALLEKSCSIPAYLSGRTFCFFFRHILVMLHYRQNIRKFGNSGTFSCPYH
jgi:hypothetical protein